MSTQAERDAQDVLCSVIDVRLTARKLERAARGNREAVALAQEIDAKSLKALDAACRRWFPGDTISDLEPPAA